MKNQEILTRHQEEEEYITPKTKERVDPKILGALVNKQMPKNEKTALFESKIKDPNGKETIYHAAVMRRGKEGNNDFSVYLQNPTDSTKPNKKTEFLEARITGNKVSYNIIKSKTSEKGGKTELTREPVPATPNVGKKFAAILKGMNPVTEAKEEKLNQKTA